MADESPPAIAAILGDASRGAISCDAEDVIAGYAAYGPSIKAALQPLVTAYGVELFDDGSQLRGPSAGVIETLGPADFGNSVNGEQATRIQREQVSARDLPVSLRLSYYDPLRDYQTGEARATVGEQTGNEERRELPAVLDAAAAKSLAQQNLARAWVGRDKLTLRLPPRTVLLEPGAKLDLPLSPARWTVERCTLDAYVVVADLRPSWRPGSAMSADPGRIAPVEDIVDGELTVALFDVPDVLQSSISEPTLLLAGSKPTRGWRRRAVVIGGPQQQMTVQTPSRKAVLGHALDALARSDPYLIDHMNSVEVELIDPDQWLVSCDDQGLAEGANLAVLGSELLQFGEAVATGPGRFRLGRLLRGRAGSEWAAESHLAGDAFVLIDPRWLRAVRLPAWSPGATISVSAVGSPGTTCLVGTESLRPPAPVRLDAEVNANGDLVLAWTRRSRKGWSWIDQVDVPLGESREQYRVTVVGSSASVEFVSEASTMTIAAADLPPVGTGPATIQVSQIGDWALSRPAECSVVLP